MARRAVPQCCPVAAGGGTGILRWRVYRGPTGPSKIMPKIVFILGGRLVLLNLIFNFIIMGKF